MNILQNFKSKHGMINQKIYQQFVCVSEGVYNRETWTRETNRKMDKIAGSHIFFKQITTL